MLWLKDFTYKGDLHAVGSGVGPQGAIGDPNKCY